MSLEYDEHRLTSGWHRFVSLGHPCKFQRVLHLGSVTARHSSIGRQPNFVVLNRGCHLYSSISSKLLFKAWWYCNWFLCLARSVLQCFGNFGWDDRRASGPQKPPPLILGFPLSCLQKIQGLSTTLTTFFQDSFVAQQCLNTQTNRQLLTLYTQRNSNIQHKTFIKETDGLIMQ